MNPMIRYLLQIVGPIINFVNGNNQEYKEMILSQISLYLSSIRDEILDFIPLKQIPISAYDGIGVKIGEVERYFESYDSLL